MLPHRRGGVTHLMEVPGHRAAFLQATSRIIYATYKCTPSIGCGDAGPDLICVGYGLHGRERFRLRCRAHRRALAVCSHPTRPACAFPLP